MKELIDASFSSVNLIATGLFLLIILYWITVFIGALDLEFLNFDVDGDADIDIDADVDIDVDADLDIDTDLDVDADLDTDVEGGVALSMNAILVFFNLGKVPFMILMSFFAMSFWGISVSANHLLGNTSWLISFALLIPNFIASLFVAKIMTTPFALIYSRLSSNEEDNFKYQGKMCNMLMSASDTRVGQAEIHHDSGVYRINVLTKEGASIDKGQSGLIINYIKDKNCYLVEPYKI